MISFIILLASTVLCCSYCLHRFHVVKIKLMLFDKDVGIDGDYIEKYLNYKPWREPKSRQLKVHYKSWAESWQEISRNDSDCTIYQYSIPERRSNFGATRLNEVWMWPWLWSKIKAERLSIIQKHFDSELNSVPVQEHMELDNFYSEFDMPVRWGLLRLKELEVINILILWIAFWTNFHGIKPTDLGVRPDGSVRTCSVERHNCISSSNEETDVEHYAPPFRWSRSKSPEQAFDEVKAVYSNYPKRGLKWTNGWIDRGGWKPQQFSGNYFYAQADSLAFRWTDDVELVVNSAKREVQYRSASRLGSVDFDVQRLRYNQFSRMLASKGGWEDLRQLPRLHYLSTTPFRWTNQLLDKVTALLESAVSISGYKQSFVDAWSAADKARENILSSLGHSLQQWEHIFHKEGEEFHWLIELNPLNSVYKWAGHVQDTARTLRSQPALKLTTRPSDSVGVLSDSFNGMIYKEREELIKKYLLRDEVSSQ